MSRVRGVMRVALVVVITGLVPVAAEAKECKPPNVKAPKVKEIDNKDKDTAILINMDNNNLKKLMEEKGVTSLVARTARPGAKYPAADFNINLLSDRVDAEGRFTIVLPNPLKNDKKPKGKFRVAVATGKLPKESDCIFDGLTSKFSKPKTIKVKTTKSPFSQAPIHTAFALGLTDAFGVPLPVADPPEVFRMVIDPDSIEGEELVVNGKTKPIGNKNSKKLELFHASKDNVEEASGIITVAIPEGKTLKSVTLATRSPGKTPALGEKIPMAEALPGPLPQDLPGTQFVTPLPDAIDNADGDRTVLMDLNKFSLDALIKQGVTSLVARLARPDPTTTTGVAQDYIAEFNVNLVAGSGCGQGSQVDALGRFDVTLPDPLFTGEEPLGSFVIAVATGERPENPQGKGDGLTSPFTQPPLPVFVQTAESLFTQAPTMTVTIASPTALTLNIDVETVQGEEAVLYGTVQPVPPVVEVVEIFHATKADLAASGGIMTVELCDLEVAELINNEVIPATKSLGKTPYLGTPISITTGGT